MNILIIDIAVDLFTLVDRYFCDSQRCPCLQFRPHLGTRMRVSVLHSRAIGHPICYKGRIVAMEQFDVLTLPWTTHIISPILYLLSVQPALLVKLNCNRLISIKDRFVPHRRPATIRHFLDPSRIKYSFQYMSTFARTTSLSMEYFSIKI